MCDVGENRRVPPAGRGAESGASAKEERPLSFSLGWTPSGRNWPALLFLSLLVFFAPQVEPLDSVVLLNCF